MNPPDAAPDYEFRPPTKIGSVPTKKKPPVIQFPNPKAAPQPDDRHWHNGGDIEIMMYARSLHRTAMKLVASLDLEPNVKGTCEGCRARSSCCTERRLNYN